MDSLGLVMVKGLHYSSSVAPVVGGLQFPLAGIDALQGRVVGVDLLRPVCLSSFSSRRRVSVSIDEQIVGNGSINSRRNRLIHLVWSVDRLDPGQVVSVPEASVHCSLKLGHVAVLSTPRSDPVQPTKLAFLRLS